ncbi:MAG: hypothetical protein HOV79_31535 [Hamadaea sp.]|nr:hypothetical protein [Hamadaea sp.]
MTSRPDLTMPTYVGRVPDGLAVTLTVPPLRYGWRVSRRALLTMYLPLAVLCAALAVRSWLVAAVLVTLVVLAGLLRISEEASKARTPLLGFDRDGLYLRADGNRSYTLHLPWGHVRDLAVRQSGGVPALCVTPADSSFTGLVHESMVASRTVGFFQFARYQRRVRQLGTTLFVPIPGVDARALLASLAAQRP